MYFTVPRARRQAATREHSPRGQDADGLSGDSVNQWTSSPGSSESHPAAGTSGGPSRPRDRRRRKVEQFAPSLKLRSRTSAIRGATRLADRDPGEATKHELDRDPSEGSTARRKCEETTTAADHCRSGQAALENAGHGAMSGIHDPAHRKNGWKRIGLPSVERASAAAVAANGAHGTRPESANLDDME